MEDRSVLSLRDEIEFYGEEPLIAGIEMRDKWLISIEASKALEEQTIRREWEKFFLCKEILKNYRRNRRKGRKARRRRKEGRKARRRRREVRKVLTKILAIQSKKFPEIYRRFEEIYQILSKEGKGIKEMKEINIINLLYYS